MRLRFFGSSAILPLVSLACAGSGVAVAEPRKAAEADQPLVRSEIKDDADLARAIREHYTKYEYRIGMRDGVALHTNAYVPKAAESDFRVATHRVHRTPDRASSLRVLVTAGAPP